MGALADGIRDAIDAAMAIHVAAYGGSSLRSTIKAGLCQAIGDAIEAQAADIVDEGGGGGGGGAVTSVFGRTGAVVAQSGDYNATDVGADPAGTASAAVSTHAGLSDPHTGYVLESREGQSNGIATLDGTTLVPIAQMASSGSSGWLNRSRVWSVPTYTDVGAAAASHVHSGADITSGTISETVLPTHALIGPECGFGSDGDITFNGSSTITLRGNAMVPSSSTYTLLCDVHANDIVINHGVVIITNGFVMRAHTLTLPASATVVIHDDGTSSVGTSGAGDFSNDCTTARDNGGGATGRNTSGIGASAGGLSSPAVGGAGGAGGAATSAGGLGGTVAWTSVNQSLTGWPMDPHSLISLRTITNAVWKTGAGGGAGGCSVGVSGGGGSGGGLCIVCVGSLVLGASASLTVAARGGNGGPASGTNAGGGGGGGGGCAILSRRRETIGSGASVSLVVSGGSGGAGIGTGAAGSSGSSGRSFNLIP